MDNCIQSNPQRTQWFSNKNLCELCVLCSDNIFVPCCESPAVIKLIFRQQAASKYIPLVRDLLYLNITQISNDKKIQNSFTDIIQSIISNYAPQKIVLFGSYARGDAHEGSDIDLMLIKETSMRFIDRIADVIRLNNTLISLEPLVYSPFEFIQCKICSKDVKISERKEITTLSIEDAHRAMANCRKNQKFI